MISAFRRAGSFRGESAVTTWLHRIVVNACLDKMRRRAARPEIAGGDERLLDNITSSASADPADGSDVAVEVMAALHQLPYDQQVALVLVDMLEYPVADAAALLGVAQGTVKSRCARGRARLLPRLAHLRQAQRSDASGKDAAGQGGGRRSLPGGGREPSGGAEPGDGYAFGNSAPEPGQPTRNRWTSGSVLPGREGGDEEA